MRLAYVVTPPEFEATGPDDKNPDYYRLTVRSWAGWVDADDLPDLPDGTMVWGPVYLLDPIKIGDRP